MRDERTLATTSDGYSRAEVALLRWDGTEPDAAEYARQAVRLRCVDPTGETTMLVNEAEVRFPEANEPWGEIVRFAFCRKGLPNVLGELRQPVFLTNGYSLVFRAGALVTPADAGEFGASHE